VQFNATRLTSFALISAIEADARSQILGVEDVDALRWPMHAVDRARARVSKDPEIASALEPIEVVDYLDFADAYEVLLANMKSLHDKMRESLKAVKPQLQRLTDVRNRVAHTRPMEIDDLATVYDVSRALVKADPHGWPTVVATLDRLQMDPAYVLGLTIQLPVDPSTERAHNLPIPDFDETGFFGRDKELARVKRAILGPYPVVSILGDGGIGKTSLALKAAYELLDDPKANFDSIVWVSAKSTTLTSSEIRNISGAIQDSLGMFRAAAEELGGVNASSADPEAEVLEYLETFRVLLILDNLETVNDQRLRDFLLDLPNGSKVLLTSRIGLGIENPVKVGPLPLEQTVRLLRALASIRSVDVIKILDKPGIEGLAAKLNGHPLYVRWLVAGVQSGRRPSDLVSDNSLLLDYCMSNVFEQLTTTSRGVLQSMQVMRGVRSQAELAFLNSMTAQEIQAALLELLTTNFVVLRNSAVQELEASYETSEFAVKYLSRTNPVDPAFRSKVQALADELLRFGKRLTANSRSKYESKTVDVRGQDDVPVARILIEAQRRQAEGDPDKAIELCHEAQTLAPTYYEAWRVEATIHAARRDRYAATLAFERAQELAPQNDAVAFQFARFLAEEGEQVRALNLLQNAAHIDPTSPQLLLEIARLHHALGNHTETVDTVSRIVDLPQTQSFRARAVRLSTASARLGAVRMQDSGDLSGALEIVENALDVATNVDVEHVDSVSVDLLIALGEVCRTLEDDSNGVPYLVDKSREFQKRATDRVRVVSTASLSRRIGEVRQVDFERLFGFARNNDGDYFFHRNDLLVRTQWDEIRQGATVAFKPDPKNQKGPKALNVRVLK
jgi:tetratricopeptide (TPR) repeat protein